MPAEALRRRVDDSDDGVPGMMAWTTNALGRTTVQTIVTVQDRRSMCECDEDT